MNPVLNPYNPNAIILITQDAVFRPADGGPLVVITATLKRAGVISNQDIIFEVVSGNGFLNPGNISVGQSITVKTDENGKATRHYNVGSVSGIAEVRVKIPAN